MLIVLVLTAPRICRPHRLNPLAARAARADAQIHNIELSLTAMLADAGKKSFDHMWRVNNPVPSDLFTNPDNLASAMQVYERAFCALLRHGGGAESDPDWPPELDLIDDVAQILGHTYMDLGSDPWGNRYQFCPGPWQHSIIPFRVYQRDNAIPGLPPDDTGEVTYKDIETGKSIKAGYPAPKDMTVYIYSMGQNLRTDQLLSADCASPDAGPDCIGGRDDINNWDDGQSWMICYR